MCMISLALATREFIIHSDLMWTFGLEICPQGSWMPPLPFEVPALSLEIPCCAAIQGPQGQTSWSKLSSLVYRPLRPKHALLHCISIHFTAFTHFLHWCDRLIWYLVVYKTHTKIHMIFETHTTYSTVYINRPRLPSIFSEFILAVLWWEGEFEEVDACSSCVATPIMTSALRLLVTLHLHLILGNFWQKH